MKSYIICARVSSVAQLKTGGSIAEQLASERAYVESIGGVVLEEIVDDCSGTIPIRERPGGERLYHFIDHKLAGGVVFDVSDRVGRDTFAIDALTLLRDLQLADLEMHVVNRGQIDFNNPADILLFFIEGQRASDEIKTLVDRLYRRGRLAKAKRGEIVGHTLPYGFQKIRIDDKHKDFAINESEAAVIRRCAGLVIKNNMPVRSIAALLTTEGVPLPRSTKPRTTTRWHPTTLHKIFNNSSTSGRFSFAGIEIVRPDLVILTEEERAAVRAKVTTFRVTSKRNSKRVYQLGGRIRCVCGRMMTGIAPGTNRKVLRYRCVNHKSETIRPPSTRAAETEAAAWSWLTNIFENLDLLRAGIARKMKLDRADEGLFAAQLKLLERTYAQDDAELNTMARRMGGLSDLAAGAMATQMNALSNKLRATKAEIETLRLRLANLPRMPDQAAIEALAATVRDKMNTSDEVKRKGVLAALDVRLQMSHYDDDQIYFNISSTLFNDVIADMRSYTKVLNYPSRHDIEGVISVRRVSLNNWHRKDTSTSRQSASTPCRL